jgi:hypothetical protein
MTKELYSHVLNKATSEAMNSQQMSPADVIAALDSVKFNVHLALAKKAEETKIIRPGGLLGG